MKSSDPTTLKTKYNDPNNNRWGETRSVSSSRLRQAPCAFSLVPTYARATRPQHHLTPHATHIYTTRLVLFLLTYPPFSTGSGVVKTVRVQEITKKRNRCAHATSTSLYGEPGRALVTPSCARLFILTLSRFATALDHDQQEIQRDDVVKVHIHTPSTHTHTQHTHTQVHMHTTKNT